MRHASLHAGGVGIVDTKITDYIGMKLGGKDEHVIQVDKKKVEEIGIIKFDIRASYGQEERKNVLLGISFDSVERLQQ